MSSPGWHDILREVTVAVNRQPTRLAVAVVVAVVLAAVAGPARAATWFLLGGADWPEVVEPLSGGRTLVCSRLRCDVWDVATGVSASTSALPLRPGGGVVYARASGSCATDVWSSPARSQAPAGGIFGGIGAHALANSPSSRAPVTAGGLAIPYLITLVVAFH